MIGTKLAHYEITSNLGTGGMGEVYQATDSKLGRSVAIKLLPEAFTNDADRAARFEREARVLASLNHPNIAAIHGIEEFDGRKFLVMELVPGETLAARIKRGPIPLVEALGIATQITHALEEAHEKNIVHRDLKPANVMITPVGNVKVLDFGLAKSYTPDVADASLSDSPTLSATATGVILGTMAYMSPEQAKGRDVDRRTDIFAFGCVLFEILTRRKAFEGEDVPDILGAVLKSDPDWTLLPSVVPVRIRDVLRVCLQKDPKKRRQTATDVKIDIELAQSTASDGGSLASPAGSRPKERIVLVSALALVTLIAALLGLRALRPATTLPEAWLEINTPPGTDPSLALSPDGLQIIFAARSTEGQPQLWLRSLNSELVRPLKGTEGASFPFWKPDSRSIGFFAENKLKLMDIDDLTVKTLVSAITLPLGGAWNSDGTIIFAPNPGKPILRVSDEGGDVSAVTRFESPQQRSQSSPQFLPGGRHFLFFVDGAEARGVYIGQLDRLETTRLFDAAAPAVYTANGHLLFIRDGKLLAQGFDVDGLKTKGTPFQIAESVTKGTILSASAAGSIAYRTPSADSGQQQLLWVDRGGNEIEKEVYSDTAMLNPALSRDGRRVAVLRLTNGNVDIWTSERGRHTWEPITSDPGDDIMPVFSPGDTRMVFGSRRGDMNLYLKVLSDPLGSEKLLLPSPHPKFPMDWSANGDFLLYDSLDPKSGYDMWALPMDGNDRNPFVVERTNSNERLSQFTQDGNWIAYQSDKTGRPEIYVQPFRRPGDASPVARTPVSIDGGTQARWNPNDNTELFYIGSDDRLMTVRIRFASDGKTVVAETPRGLFPTTVGRTAVSTSRHKYAVSWDGKSFMMNSALGEISTQPIKVILNWKPKP